MRGSDLHVIVVAPRDPEPKEFAFPPEEKVGQAANDAAAKFGYVTSNFSFQTVSAGPCSDGISRWRSAGVRDGEKLTIVDVGGGV